MPTTPQTIDLPMKMVDEQLSLSLDILDSATSKALVPYDVEYVVYKIQPFPKLMWSPQTQSQQIVFVLKIGMYQGEFTELIYA